MDWNIFSPLKRTRTRGKAKDHFDEFINVIETFAPREYLSEREVFYYHYRIMDAYKRQLLELLERLSRKKDLIDHPDQHARALFLRLKDFYDTKNTLSLEKSLSDRNLLRRFRGLFLYFYGREQLTREEMERWLKPLKET